jgi:hypothetical protein
MDMHTYDTLSLNCFYIYGGFSLLMDAIDIHDLCDPGFRVPRSLARVP